jgi:hypothetical protein
VSRVRLFSSSKKLSCTEVVGFAGKDDTTKENTIMMRELTDAELDVVAAGSNQGNNGTGLVVVGANVGDITVTAVDVLSHNAILNNSANGNTVQVPIGVAVAVLSGATGVLQHL